MRSKPTRGQEAPPSGESALFVRVVTEGLLASGPRGCVRSPSCRSAAGGAAEMRLSAVRICGASYDIEIGHRAGLCGKTAVSRAAEQANAFIGLTPQRQRRATARRNDAPTRRRGRKFLPPF
ncbi:MAG: hypothetical protein ACLUFV_13070 [Acutalibacteraceae bacterium]